MHLAVGIYDGVIEAMSILCDNFSEASIKIIEHKFGQDVGQVVRDGK